MKINEVINESKDNAAMEELADIEHERWSEWQKHLFSKCTKNDDGSMTIPKDSVDRWQRQIATKYKDLSEDEKQSDRDQVNKYLPTVKKRIKEL